MVLPLLRCRPRLLQLPGGSSRSNWERKGGIDGSEPQEWDRRDCQEDLRACSAAARVREKPAASPLSCDHLERRGELSFPLVML